jgi:hypothetical protein
MTLQYIRKSQLLALNDKQALDLSQLHFRFMVRRGDRQTPNSADIRIYNPSEATAQQFVKSEFSTMSLQCGYEGNFAVIFQGTIKQSRYGRESPVDTYLDITAADGDSYYNFAVVNFSLSAGSKQADHVNAIINNAQNYGNQEITPGYISGLSDSQLPRGKVFYGQAKDMLRKIATTQDADYHIQNGELNFIPRNNFQPVAPVEINAANGMVGLPEQTQNGIRVRCLLNPSIKIGSLINLNNKSIQQYRFGLSLNDAAQNSLLNQTIHLNRDGLYKVLWIDYIGNTRGQEWYSEITCIAADAAYSQAILNRTQAAPAEAANVPINVYGN